MKKTLWILSALLMAALLTAGPAMAGPYTDCGEGVAISEINAWATGYLGYLPSDPLDPEKYGQYTPGGGVFSTFQTPNAATGEADGAIVTLGDLRQEQNDAGAVVGEITLTFDSAITNGNGNDFAVLLKNARKYKFFANKSKPSSP